MGGIITDQRGSVLDADHPTQGVSFPRCSTVQVYELRDCLILDYTAYNTDQVEGRQVNGALSPFFNDEVAITRWTNYGVLAQFKDGASEIAYLKDAHQVVQRDLFRYMAQLNNAR